MVELEAHERSKRLGRAQPVMKRPQPARLPGTPARRPPRPAFPPARAGPSCSEGCAARLGLRGSIIFMLPIHSANFAAPLHHCRKSRV